MICIVGSVVWLMLSYFLIGPFLSRRAYRSYKKWGSQSDWMPAEMLYALSPLWPYLLFIMLVVWLAIRLSDRVSASKFFIWLIYGSEEK